MKAIVAGLLLLTVASARGFVAGDCPDNLPLIQPGVTYTGNTCLQGNGYRPHCYPGANRSDDAGYAIDMPAGPYTVTLGFPVGVTPWQATVEVRDLAHGLCTAGVYGCARARGTTAVTTYSGFDTTRRLGVFIDGSGAGNCGAYTLTVTSTP